MTGSYLALAGGLQAADPADADGGRVRGLRWQHQPVAGTQIGIAAAGVEGDPAADAIQDLSIAVLVLAVGVTGGIAQACGARPSAR